MHVLDLGAVSSLPKEMGALLYSVATKVKPCHASFLGAFVKMVIDN